MMIPPEELTRKKLAKLLIDKHHRFLKKYRRELEVLERVVLLMEKEEQLEYWAKVAYEDGDDEGYEKFLKQRELTDKKISQSIGELKRINPDIKKNEFKKRHSFLLKSMKEHRSALDYWNRIYKDSRI
ncbi:MAG: hypothetical protein DRO90_00510 [Candidatus Altiarchaeales archaeon]|nr:MAG: hypothetical protein DRO95_00985 [Candidatus Altiarchaeales archaeon]RLI95327.1 MAG: hypothetical protein DRO90_00510 [Candidatus Altiarchaeales archaeon]HDO82222.1 hypothetical protein [Candidatus Altiarchaeales archaeon]HEX54871.1 hypothetical protein [Candidatus Altiarchaeales archaeon]